MQRSVTAKIDCSGFVASWSNDLLASSASTKCDVLAKAMRASFSYCCSTQRARMDTGPPSTGVAIANGRGHGRFPFSEPQKHAKTTQSISLTYRRATVLGRPRRRSSIHGRDSHTSDITLCRQRKEGPRCTPVLPATTSQQFASLVQRHKTMCHARARDERTGHRDCSVCPLTCL